MKFFAPTRISEKMYKTPEGYLVCVGVPIARTGEMLYAKGELPLEADDEGKIVITRSEEEVFRPVTLASFEGKAVTIRHPQEDVTPDNHSELARGSMLNVRRGKGEHKDDMMADLLITDAIAIGLIEKGLREVSCGYEAEYTQTEKGKGYQTNIVGNHLALVEQGRAGISYSIKDHKPKGEKKMGKFHDKLTKLFAKVADEASQLIEDENEATNGGKKKKTGDAEGEQVEAGSYDELVKCFKDLGAKIEGMMAKKKEDAGDEEQEKPAPAKKKKEEAGDEEVAPSLEDRLKALELAVAKLLEGESEEAAEETGDEDDPMEAAEETDDEEMEETVLTGDTAERVEILAPGLKPKAKTAKADALKKAYATADGKKVIDQIAGGKPKFDNPTKVDMMFVAASELLKANRSTALSKTKTTDYRSTIFNDDKVMTAEKMNEINAKRYNQTK